MNRTIPTHSYRQLRCHPSKRMMHCRIADGIRLMAYRRSGVRRVAFDRRHPSIPPLYYPIRNYRSKLYRPRPPFPTAIVLFCDLCLRFRSLLPKERSRIPRRRRLPSPSVLNLLSSRAMQSRRTLPHLTHLLISVHRPDKKSSFEKRTRPPRLFLQRRNNRPTMPIPMPCRSRKI
jgi:hypothetical protein